MASPVDHRQERGGGWAEDGRRADVRPFNVAAEEVVRVSSEKALSA